MENVQAGTGDHGADSACFVIVFVVAGHVGHVGHVSGTHAMSWHACRRYHADDGGGNRVGQERRIGRMQ